ncbi:MAG: DNA repair protein RadC [Clostridia bacterium]|nr:DNA repair protein RadC [Clostridia bacterium]
MQNNSPAEKKKGIHTDHRKRMRGKVVSGNEKTLDAHNLLELLLFYSIPRRDTNPLAHELIDKYGTLSGVFDADYQSLCKTDGVSESTAVLIKAIREVMRRYDIEEYDGKPVLDSFDKIGDYLVKYYRGLSKEIVYVMLFDNGKRLISTEKIHEGSVNSALVDYSKIVKLAIERNASSIVIAHNHPLGQALPSGDDLSTTRTLKGLFELMKIPLCEHYIIAGNNYFGLICGRSGRFKNRE